MGVGSVCPELMVSLCLVPPRCPRPEYQANPLKVGACSCLHCPGEGPDPCTQCQPPFLQPHTVFLSMSEL